MSSVNNSFIGGILWSFLGRGGHLLISLITSVVLARMLTPYEFGQVGIVMFFIIISKVLTESGLSGALIRKVDATEDDFSTVFVFNLIISVLLFFIIIMISGPIANFYDDQNLRNILIALSFILIINAFQFTQTARIVRDLKFRRQALYNFISVLLSSVLGIVLASKGFGVWSIVGIQISNAIFLVIIYRMFEGASGRFVFKRDSFLKLYKFGLNTTLANIINTAFDNVYNLILGRYFAIYQTGLYYQAKRLQEVPVGVIQASTSGVVFSTLAKLQDTRDKFDCLYGQVMTYFTALSGLICTLIFFYADQIILIFYGAQWVESGFYLKILIASSFFYMLESFNRVLFKIFDRTEKILILELVKVFIQSITIVVGVIFLDISVLLYGFVITSIFSYFINYYTSRKIYNGFSWVEIITTFKVLFSAILTVVCGNLINHFLELREFMTLLQLPVLLSLYVCLLFISKALDMKKDATSIMNLIRQRKLK